MIANLTAPLTLDALFKDYPWLPGAFFAVLCLIVGFLVSLPRIAAWRRAKGRPVLNPLQLEAMLTGSGALVVDLRNAQDFAKGHIRGCLHVPFAEFQARFTQPDPKAKRAMILVDETDILSHQALDLLTARGFTWIYVLKGGMEAWRSASRPLVR
jgi:rhodanese-related sulfurtransferase